MTPPRRVLAIGHRGAAAHMPENTLPSFEKALELGADGIEFDVALSRDGVPVVLHDDTLDRTTDGHGPVEEATFDELRRLDAGSWKNVPAHVPSLAEVLAAFASRAVLNLEIKFSPRREALVEACAAAVREHEAAGVVVFSSFDHEALRVLRSEMPEARIGVLATSAGADDAMACAAGLAAENLHPPLDLVGEALVSRAHAAGLQVWAWTANRRVAIEHVIRCGVDAVFSDYPERVVEARG